MKSYCDRSEEHTSELQSPYDLVCRLLLVTPPSQSSPLSLHDALPISEKRKLGVVDFDDLLLRTLALLDDQAVLERARSQYDFIFVDEFQDTDRTQARIIERR